MNRRALFRLLPMAPAALIQPPREVAKPLPVVGEASDVWGYQINDAIRQLQDSVLLASKPVVRPYLVGRKLTDR